MVCLPLTERPRPGPRAAGEPRERGNPRLKAIGHRGQRKPLKITHPITVELSFKNYRAAEVLTYLRAIQRADAHSVRFVGQDMREVSDFVDFVDFYNPDLTP